MGKECKSEGGIFLKVEQLFCKKVQGFTLQLCHYNSLAMKEQPCLPTQPFSWSYSSVPSFATIWLLISSWSELEQRPKITENNLVGFCVWWFFWAFFFPFYFGWSGKRRHILNAFYISESTYDVSRHPTQAKHKGVATPISKGCLLNRDSCTLNSGIFWKWRRLNFATTGTLWSGFLKVPSTRQKYPW